MEHGVGKRGSFRARQPFQQRGHEPRRNLVVGNLSGGVAAYQKFDFRARQLGAVAFFADHINGAESAVAGGFGGAAHWRRNPSGSRPVIGISSSSPDLPRKKT